ncbi:cilia- and flagella-associated protein 221 [Paramormyrops kingsleyae]|uniref:cilia- and flagella-associated protein 221 n=1 Tax=Paramormyrops kingsleyae TaxID=1676925 RepID=UPI000CD5EFBF|nr:cilia- and flagella-associated protein 221 [Paramormyrops kingsleyae]XP_023682425.1 cilia- and flagella-associated protein 221 [Paramormyrops kingsleyae]
MQSRHLHEAMSQIMMGSQRRQVKEAAFENKVHQDVLEEKANHLAWQVHRGKDPVSPQTKRQILEERNIVNREFKGETGHEEDFVRIQPWLSTGRVQRSQDELPVCVPLYPVYHKSSFETRHKGRCLFQQAARKVLLRCRMECMLASLRPVVQSMKRLSSAKAGVISLTRVPDEMEVPLKLSQDNFLPFTFPLEILPSQDTAALGVVSVTLNNAQPEIHIPFFRLKVPLLYKLKGYKPVSAFEAFTSFVPQSLARPLRTGAQDELLPPVIRPSEYDLEDQEKNGTSSLLEGSSYLTFTAPTAIFCSPDAHPLRVFNPAPGLHEFKPPLPYLESELDFYLCPLLRGISAKGTGNTYSLRSQKKFLDKMVNLKEQEVIRGVMTWKKFESAVLSTLSSSSPETTAWVPCMSDLFNEDILPAMAPPPMERIPEDLKEDLQDGLSTNVGFTSAMVRAKFPLIERHQPRQLKLETVKDESTFFLHRIKKHQQLEPRSQTSNLGPRVEARLSQMKVMVTSSVNY